MILVVLPRAWEIFAYGSSFSLLQNQSSGRGLKLPNWGVSEKKWRTSIVVRVFLYYTRLP